jgi:uncharacterized protein
MNGFKSISKEIENLYSEMSEESSLYQKKNSIYCPVKCDNCCKNPSVSSTPLEMLPLALELIKNNNTDLDWNKETCLFNNKGCSVYSVRPTVCRLFGWSQVSAKDGRRLSICPKTVSNGVLNANAPDIEMWSRKIKEIHPEWSNQILPINQSLKIMVEKVLFYQSFESK